MKFPSKLVKKQFIFMFLGRKISSCFFVLITTGANIDMKQGKISFQIGDEIVDFHVFGSMKFSSNDNNTICRIEIVDTIVAEEMDAVLGGEQLD